MGVTLADPREPHDPFSHHRLSHACLDVGKQPGWAFNAIHVQHDQSSLARLGSEFVGQVEVRLRKGGYPGFWRHSLPVGDFGLDIRKNLVICDRTMADAIEGRSEARDRCRDQRPAGTADPACLPQRRYTLVAFSQVVERPNSNTTSNDPASNANARASPCVTENDGG